MEKNDEKLYEAINNINESISLLRVGFSTLTAKIDDFSYRLRKLEERDDKRLEREERVSVLLARTEKSIQTTEDAIRKNEKELLALQGRLDMVESDVVYLRNNWRWVAAITAALGTAAGIIVSILSKIK